MTHTRKKWIAILTTWFIICPLVSCGIVHAAEIQTKHTAIRFNSPADLIRFNRAISGPGIFTFLSDKTAGERVDEIFERVQDILGMTDQAFPGLPIDITQDRETLLKILNQGRTISDTKVPKGFYKYRTVYMFIGDVAAGVLAHEMAHHIIDTYLLVRPPSKTAEILAQYVERNL